MSPMSNSKPFIFVIVIVPLLGTVLAIRLLWERLLDIGCGWGGLLIYAAQHYDVEADGITSVCSRQSWRVSGSSKREKILFTTFP